MPISSAWTDPNSLDLTTGQVLTQTVWENLIGNALWLGGTTGAFASFSPTLTQGGSVTITAVGRYVQIGKLVLGTINISLSGSGTGGNAIVLGGLPVTPRSNNGGVCMAFYFDTSASTYYALMGALGNTTSVTFYPGAGGFGVSPAVTAASGDGLQVTFLYEAA